MHLQKLAAQQAHNTELARKVHEERASRAATMETRNVLKQVHTLDLVSTEGAARRADTGTHDHRQALHVAKSDMADSNEWSRLTRYQVMPCCVLLPAASCGPAGQGAAHARTPGQVQQQASTACPRPPQQGAAASPAGRTAGAAQQTPGAALRRPLAAALL
jgi:hypothetical protein